jgi:hypothetical protein
MYVFCFYPMTGVIDVPLDIRTDAEQKRDDRIRTAENFSKYIRVYVAIIPWARVVKLYARLTSHCGFLLMTKNADNLGLMPYRRRIVSVSKWTPVLHFFLLDICSKF